jgi:hypothetical protein
MIDQIIHATVLRLYSTKNMIMKKIFFMISFCCLSQMQMIYSQDASCPKLRIGVYLNDIFAADTTAGYLNTTHDKNYTASEWAAEIESYILETLSSAGYNNLEFFRTTPDSDEDMDMEFRFSLYPWTVDGEEKIPAYEVKYVDPVTGWEVTEYRAPVYDPQLAFLMYSSLVVCSPCVPLMTYIISIEKAIETNIYQLIKNLIYHYNFPLDLTIHNWEAKHPAPARKPQMEIRYQKEYLSLLDEETRKMEVYIKVKNCYGKYVYDKFHGQPVYFLKEMERLEYKDDPGNRCQVGFDWGIFSTVFTSEDFGAIGQYKVKKGIDPSIEKARFKTCGIGKNSLIEVEGEIKVLGLELEVDPDRSTVNVGEKTSIQIDLHEIDPDGTEILSCEGREVDVQVTGVVDGTISHESGKITLDEGGVAFIDYEAGENDRKIRINASFTPPGYPETVTGEATITVRKDEGDFNGTIMYERQVHWEDEAKSTYSTIFKKVDVVENASINVAAKYLRTITDTQGKSELFEAKPLSGNFSASVTKVTVVTDHHGDWTKTVETWQGDKMMDPESFSNILLTVEPQKKNYILQAEIRFPGIEGDTEYTTSGGAHWTTDTEPWGLNASFEYEGQTDGNSVNGHWSQPATGPILVLPSSGFIPGATWNWSMSRAKKSNK